MFLMGALGAYLGIYVAAAVVPAVVLLVYVYRQDKVE